MPTLALTNFNILVGLLGGWISLFGLVSYLCKENYYLSEARKSHRCSRVSLPTGAPNGEYGVKGRSRCA